MFTLSWNYSIFHCLILSEAHGCDVIYEYCSPESPLLFRQNQSHSSLYSICGFKHAAICIYPKPTLKKATFPLNKWSWWAALLQSPTSCLNDSCFVLFFCGVLKDQFITKIIIFSIVSKILDEGGVLWICQGVKKHFLFMWLYINTLSCPWLVLESRKLSSISWCRAVNDYLDFLFHMFGWCVKHLLCRCTCWLEFMRWMWET